MSSTTTPTLIKGDDSERPLPYRWVICGTCRGEGRSSAYLGAFSAEQMREDPDFAADYCAGEYDRACDRCGGSGKVKVVDERRCRPEDLAEYRRQQADFAEIDRIQRQEMLMEGGWREEGWFA